MSELVDLAQKVAGWARPGEQVEAFVYRSTNTEVRAYNGEVEQLTSAVSAGAGVRVVADGRQGFAYAGSLDMDLVAEALAEARDNAGAAGHEPWVGLPEPDGVVPVEVDRWHEELEGLAVEAKVLSALDLERRALAADPRVKSVRTASWSDGRLEVALANSLGVSAQEKATSCSLSVNLVARDGDESRTGYGLTAARRPSELDPERAAADAVDRAVRLLGALKPRSAHLPVVFEPQVSTQLLRLIGSALSGESVLKGTSLFADRLGEEVAAGMFTLVDDPTKSEAWGAAATDDEGLASRPNVLIDGGVLRGFLYDTTSARRAGTTSTASATRGGFRSPPGVGVRALFAQPGPLSRDEVLAQVGQGLLVQSLTGLHSGVNLVSGDFSVGAEGLLIEGGALGTPVKQVTIASSIQRMLQGVVAVGADIEWLPSSAAGLTLAIGEMSMSGT